MDNSLYIYPVSVSLKFRPTSELDKIKHIGENENNSWNCLVCFVVAISDNNKMIANFSIALK